MMADLVHISNNHREQPLSPPLSTMSDEDGSFLDGLMELDSFGFGGLDDATPAMMVS